MTTNPFTERYKTTDTFTLFEILDNPGKYQPQAIKAARLEIESRKLTPEKIDEVRTEQNLKRHAIEIRRQKIKDIEHKIKTASSNVAETINPIQAESPSSEKYIKILSVFLGVLFIYQLSNEHSMINFMFTNINAKWDISMMLYFLPLVLLPAAAVFLWLKKKTGWILAAIFFSNTLAGIILSFIMEINRKPTGFPALDNLFPPHSPMIYLGTVLLFGAPMWMLCKENLREVYRIRKQTMVMTISAGVGPTVMTYLTI